MTGLTWSLLLVNSAQDQPRECSWVQHPLWQRTAWPPAIIILMWEDVRSPHPILFIGIPKWVTFPNEPGHQAAAPTTNQLGMWSKSANHAFSTIFFISSSGVENSRIKMIMTCHDQSEAGTAGVRALHGAAKPRKWLWVIERFPGTKRRTLLLTARNTSHCFEI